VKILPVADSSCCGTGSKEKKASCCPSGNIHEIQERTCYDNTAEVCCGGPPPPKSDPYELPGYRLCPYVQAFKQIGGNHVPLVATHLTVRDKWGTVFARLGINRDTYTVAPGLYGIGEPGSDAPVIVTANYKLTFDAVRQELRDVDAWLLVLDTCGINVWCAAGKKTFSTAEIVNRLQLSGLSEKVSHRRLIVPQLGATGVSAHAVKKQTGFTVVYGPIRAADLRNFLSHGQKADREMRLVTFTFRERMVLIPVEFTLFGKKIWWVVPALLVISGIGPWIFSFSRAWERGLIAIAAVFFGTVAGAMLVPMFLPWLPGRSFSLKGAITGLVFGSLAILLLGVNNFPDKISIIGCIAALSSYLAMNFTGSTPYTSPSGVEKEMKLAIPIQAVTLVCALVLWIAAPFIG
jgi:hypothetical protein